MGAAVVAAGVSRAPFSRAHIYGAGSTLPAPTAGWTWTLAPEMYVVPLAAAAALILVLRLIVALRARRTHVPPAPPPAADEDNGCEAPSSGTPAAPPSCSESTVLVPVSGVTPLVVPSDAVVDAHGHRLAKPSSWAAVAAAQAIVFLCGLGFGLGLGLSGMTSPNKVGGWAGGGSGLRQGAQTRLRFMRACTHSRVCCLLRSYSCAAAPCLCLSHARTIVLAPLPFPRRSSGSSTLPATAAGTLS
jgi:hypothetical protein